MNENCQSCRFYRAQTYYGAPGYGECRFMAPVINPAHPDVAWPIVKGERDWCGQYRASDADLFPIAQPTWVAA